MTWQPIETAPKDGSKVLVWWEYWSGTPLVAYFKHREWWAEASLSGGDSPGPTHWMPLPAPPSDVQGQEGQ